MAIGTGVVDNSSMTAIAISSEKIHIIIQVHYASVQEKAPHLIASVQTVYFFLMQPF
jgi:hypothetical protein